MPGNKTRKFLDGDADRKLLTILVIIFGCLTFVSLVENVGGAGVLNDLYPALEEIEGLEKKNLLENPPQDISDIAKTEIELFHNSEGLKQYIKKTEESLMNWHYFFVVSTILFFLTLLLRIYFRKKRTHSRY